MVTGAAFDFHFDEALRDRGVTGAYSLLLGADQNRTPPDEIAAFVDGVVADVREQAVRDLIASDPVYAGFRELHKSFEVPTRKLFAASETLSNTGTLCAPCSNVWPPLPGVTPATSLVP